MTSRAANSIAFELAIIAIILEYTVSSNLLTWAGSSYDSDGGWLIAKIHPGSYVAAAAMLARMIGCAAAGEGPWLFAWRAPNLSLFLAAMIACAVYAVAMTGAGGIIVILDSFVPAGLLALALLDISERQSAIVRRLLLSLLITNALVALGEAYYARHLVPLPPRLPELPADFRPTALFDHPLTAAAATMLGMLLPRAPGGSVFTLWGCRALMGAALLVYGGRVAVALTLLAFIGIACYRLWRLASRRRLFLSNLVPTGLVAVGVAGLAMLTVATGMASRLVSHLFWDPSAQARLFQFRLLDLLTAPQLVFGCQRQHLIALIEPLRLAYGVDVIENFWLLLFVTFGCFGFVIFLLGFLALLRHLWQSPAIEGKCMVIVLLVAASCSNSLGRKSTLLTMLVACVAATGAVKSPAVVATLPGHARRYAAMA